MAGGGQVFWPIESNLQDACWARCSSSAPHYVEELQDGALFKLARAPSSFFPPLGVLCEGGPQDTCTMRCFMARPHASSECQLQPSERRIGGPVEQDDPLTQIDACDGLLSLSTVPPSLQPHAPSPPPQGVEADLSDCVQSQCRTTTWSDVRVQRQAHQLAHWRALVTRFPSDPMTPFWREQCTKIELALVLHERLGQKRRATEDLPPQKRSCWR